VILGEGVTLDMLIGGIIMLAGIGLTFSPEKSVSQLAES
jgi:hypothetical protein